MRGQEHLAIGLTSSGLLYWCVQSTGAPVALSSAAVGAAVVAVGSLAPDIDHRDSTISRRLPTTLIAFGLTLLLMAAVIAFSPKGSPVAGVWGQVAPFGLKWGAVLTGVALALFAASRKVTDSLDHRGPIHSLSAAVLATLVLTAVVALLRMPPWYGLLFGFGWLTHLFADATTKKGLPSLFWPFLEPDPALHSQLLVVILIPLMLFGLTGWYFVVGAQLPTRPSSAVATSPRATPPTADVSLARQRLREAAPEIEKTLSNPGSPVVETEGTYTSYQWDYVRKITANQAAVRTIKLTLDESGQVVGVDGN